MFERWVGFSTKNSNLTKLCRTEVSTAAFTLYLCLMFKTNECWKQEEKLIWRASYSSVNVNSCFLSRLLNPHIKKRISDLSGMSFSDKFYNIWWGQDPNAKKAGLSHFLILDRRSLMRSSHPWRRWTGNIPGLVFIVRLALVITSRCWAAGSPAWRRLYKAVCTFCLPPGLTATLVGNYSFCGVDSSFCLAV